MTRDYSYEKNEEKQRRYREETRRNEMIAAEIGKRWSKSNISGSDVMSDSERNEMIVDRINKRWSKPYYLPEKEIIS